MAMTETLDVRTMVPMERHRRIFETYRNLGPGEAFVLLNDHDPRPLFYQFDAEHPGAFTWKYLEQGPKIWRVRIGRPLATSETLAETAGAGHGGRKAS